MSIPRVSSPDAHEHYNPRAERDVHRMPEGAANLLKVHRPRVESGGVERLRFICILGPPDGAQSLRASTADCCKAIIWVWQRLPRCVEGI